MKLNNNEAIKTDKQIQEEEHAKEFLIKFGQQKLKIESANYEEILSKFKFIGLTKAFKKFQTHEELLDYEEKAVINFTNKFTSVCLCPAVVGREVVDIVRKVNKQKHVVSTLLPADFSFQNTQFGKLLFLRQIK